MSVPDMGYLDIGEGFLPVLPEPREHKIIKSPVSPPDSVQDLSVPSAEEAIDLGDPKTAQGKLRRKLFDIVLSLSIGEELRRPLLYSLSVQQSARQEELLGDFLSKTKIFSKFNPDQEISKKQSLADTTYCLGLTYFVSELIRTDPVLAEKLFTHATTASSTTWPKVTSEEGVVVDDRSDRWFKGTLDELKRLASSFYTFWEDEGATHLVAANMLLGDRKRGDSLATDRELLKGMFAPLVELREGYGGKPCNLLEELWLRIADECPGWYFDAFDQRLTPREVRLVHTLASEDPKDYRESIPVNHTLGKIVETISNHTDLLNALFAFTEKVDSITPQDLNFILRKIPKGTWLGERTGCRNLLAEGTEIPNWASNLMETIDLRIMLSALRKTKGQIGYQLLGGAADDMRRVLKKSGTYSSAVRVTSSYDQDTSFRDAIEKLFTDEYASMIKRVLIDSTYKIDAVNLNRCRD